MNRTVTMPSWSAVTAGSLRGAEYSVTNTVSPLSNPPNRTSWTAPTATGSDWISLGRTVVAVRTVLLGAVVELTVDFVELADEEDDEVDVDVVVVLGVVVVLVLLEGGVVVAGVVVAGVVVAGVVVAGSAWKVNGIDSSWLLSPPLSGLV